MSYKLNEINLYNRYTFLLVFRLLEYRPIKNMGFEDVERDTKYIEPGKVWPIPGKS